MLRAGTRRQRPPGQKSGEKQRMRESAMPPKVDYIVVQAQGGGFASFGITAFQAVN
jgi:hypothetical protein